jgi:hypothetical protein
LPAGERGAKWMYPHVASASSRTWRSREQWRRGRSIRAAAAQTARI